jgi:hypothetical protein
MESIITKPDAQAMANQHQMTVHHVYVVDTHVGMRGDCEEQCISTDKGEADSWAKQWRAEYDAEGGFKVKRATYQPQAAVPETMHTALKAMHTVARANGKDWKYKLACAWASGRYWELRSITSNSDDACGLLQGMRNSPHWGPGSQFWETVKATPTHLEWVDGMHAIVS